MSTLTLVHVVISLIGILSGVVVAYGLLTAQRFPGWTLTFLLTTLATSVTGFLFFPLRPLLPSHKLGILSLIILAVAIFALYRRRLSGAWRRIYVITALLAFYFNAFVFAAQSFAKIPALKALAPTQTEPPFLIVQGALLGLFVVIIVAACVRFRVNPLTLVPDQPGASG